THPDLTFLSPRKRRAEMLESRKLLEDIIGSAVTSISFPFGGWNTAVWETARECGYETATAYRRHPRFPSPIIPVFGVYSFDTPADIITKLTPTAAPSNAQARAMLMCRFAKGSPLWCFRREYRIGRV
ncbi:MAG: polysaccharide deacetylase family protein, partial [Chitinivibrionales bacterium]|nr:polysaccharide deacetylase family protein [Chitinivibrionales bacterium]MBD3357153.1 polysaccharide deacetylase family protein [Chitinivibrionales bacterium]